MRNNWLLSFVFLLCAFSLEAQKQDSLNDLQFLLDTTATISQEISSGADSVKVRKGIKKFFFDNYPHPGKAALFSFLVPGLGQAYNGKFWKVPIVYTAVGTTIYLIGKSGREYRRYRTAYKYRVDGDDSTIDEFTQVYSQADRIKSIRDDFRKNREQAYVGLIAALALSSADAFVDAHLRQFNVSDDLSMNIKPKLTTVAGNDLAFGIGIGFRFRN